MSSSASSMDNRRPCVRWALLLGLAVAAAAFLPTLLARGGRILLRGDFVTQQIPFLLEARRAILSGSPFWSWNTFLGANFLGSYSFYVYGSPFFWPLVLLPESALPYGVSVLLLLKHAIAAGGGALYLSAYVKNRWYAVLGGLLYAFSSFSLDSTYYYHFLDVIALFPFLLAAIDRVIDRRRGALPVCLLLVFLQATTNYYFFIAVSLFFLIYLFFKWRFDENAPKALRFYIRLILLYGCAALAASFLLLPSALTLLETSKATESFGNLRDLLALLPQWPMLIKGLILPHEGIADSGVYFQFTEYCSNTAFVPLFGAVAVMAGLRRWPRAWENRLVKCLLVLSLLLVGNGLFSFFTNLLYTRWWFMLVLLLTLASLRTVERTEALPRAEARGLYTSAGKRLTVLALWVTLPFTALRLVFAYPLAGRFTGAFGEFLHLVGVNKPFSATDLKFFLLLAFLIAVNYAPLAIAVHRDRLGRAARLLAVGAAVCAVQYAAYLAVGEGLIGGKEHIPAGQEVESAAPRPEDRPATGTVYRWRSDFGGTLDNAAMLDNRPGIRTFHSFKSKATSAFGRRIGYGITAVPYTPRRFDTRAVYALLGVKEYRAEKGTSPGDGYVYSRDEGRWQVYDCEDYVPMGYAYAYYVVDDSPEPAASADTAANNQRIENMVRACVLDGETAGRLGKVLEPCPEQRLAAPWREAAADNRRNACSAFAADTRGFSAVTSGERERLVFFSVPHDRGWRAYINGEETEIYTVNYGLMGVVAPAGDDVSIAFRFETPGLRLGAAISAIAAGGLLLGGLCWRLKKRKV